MRVTCAPRIYSSVLTALNSLGVVLFGQSVDGKCDREYSKGLLDLQLDEGRV